MKNALWWVADTLVSAVVIVDRVTGISISGRDGSTVMPSGDAVALCKALCESDRLALTVAGPNARIPRDSNLYGLISDHVNEVTRDAIEIARKAKLPPSPDLFGRVTWCGETVNVADLIAHAQQVITAWRNRGGYDYSSLAGMTDAICRLEQAIPRFVKREAQR
jgi:hypothetical protein